MARAGERGRGGASASCSSAATAPCTPRPTRRSRLPELALIPAGRANNIARALGIPTERADALAVAVGAPRPLDALHVETPDSSLYAVEGVSAGFQRTRARATTRTTRPT